MASIKTHNEFISDLKIVNPKILYEFEFIDRYNGVKNKIKLIGKYGIVITTPSNLLK